MLPKPYEHVGVPVHSQVIKGKDSKEYYVSGGPASDYLQGNLSDAGVVIVKNNVTEKVFISDRTQPYFILKMILDDYENKIWIISMGNGSSVLVDRIDVEKRCGRFFREVCFVFWF
ncbi:MAG: hypothetical protein R3B53_03800 [Candidatus Paceibacterota bacterium]